MNDPLSAFLRYLSLEKAASSHTLRSYRTDLVDFQRFLAESGDPALAAVGPRVVRAWLAHLHGRRLDPASIARKLAAVRSWFRFLVRRDVLPSNPAREVRGPRLPRKLVVFLPIDESEALMEGRGLGGPGRDRALAVLELLYASGLRVSELAALDLDDLDRAERTVRVLGKGRKERVVPFGRKAARALETYLGRRAADRGPVFTNRRGGRLSVRSLHTIVRRGAAAAGLTRRVSPHTLRHTFATHLLDGGADLRVVQELLGHATPATTQIYTHVTQTAARRVYQAAHPRSRKG